jgi:hypothetical protein
VSLVPDFGSRQPTNLAYPLASKSELIAWQSGEYGAARLEPPNLTLKLQSLKMGRPFRKTGPLNKEIEDTMSKLIEGGARALGAKA